MPRREITIGEKHHGLILLSEEPKKNNRRMIRVACDCGKEAIIHLNNFRKQKTCGSCPRDNITEHRFYDTWASMKARCYRENHPNYKDYGGRGIMVQSSWVHDPRAFCEYLDNLPHAGEPGYSLDRIDNDENYKEGNLRWATYSKQNLNTRTRKDNASGVKGVSWNKTKDKWEVRYRGKYMGLYQYFLEAVFARRSAEQADNLSP